MNINAFEAGSSTALRYAQLKTKLSQIELPQQRQALLEATEPFGAQEFVGRGLLGFDSNQHWEAIRHLRSAVDKIPEDPQSYGVLAFLHVFLALAFWRDEEVVLEERFFQARRQYDQAFHYWDRMKETDLMLWHLLVATSMCLLAGRPDLAIDYSQRAENRAPFRNQNYALVTGNLKILARQFNFDGEPQVIGENGANCLGELVDLLCAQLG
jgi:tetratricopeptide (TPR) repeat protein